MNSQTFDQGYHFKQIQCLQLLLLQNEVGRNKYGIYIKVAKKIYGITVNSQGAKKGGEGKNKSVQVYKSFLIYICVLYLRLCGVMSMLTSKEYVNHSPRSLVAMEVAAVSCLIGFPSSGWMGLYLHTARVHPYSPLISKMLDKNGKIKL